MGTRVSLKYFVNGCSYILLVSRNAFDKISDSNKTKEGGRELVQMKYLHILLLSGLGLYMFLDLHCSSSVQCYYKSTGSLLKY